MLRPRARALGLLLGAGGLGYLGTRQGADVFVWFAVGLGVLLALSGVHSLLAFARDSRIRVSRLLAPGQLQVGVEARSELRWPPKRRPRHAYRVVDHGPGQDFTPSRRGRLALGPVMLHRGDPFGLFTWRTRVGHKQEVLVWPRVDAPPPEVFVNLLHTVVGTSGVGAPDIDDVMLREYQHGDPLSRVYWKRTSVAGDLLVRRDEPSKEPDVTLVLVPGSHDSTDGAVDTLASAVNAFISPQRVVRVLAGAEQAQGGFSELLTFLALAPSGAPHLPSHTPTGVVVVAVADPTPAVARDIRVWVQTHGVDPSLVAILTAGAVDDETRGLLDPFTVVGPWPE